MRTLVLVVLSLLASVATAERLPVQSLKPLVLLAVEHGQSEGVLVGPMAEQFAQTFDSREPVEVDLRLVEPLPQTGCYRFEAQTRQRGIVDFDRERQRLPRADAHVTYRFAWCKEGGLMEPYPQ